MLNVKVGDWVVRHLYGWNDRETLIRVTKITPTGYIVCNNGKRYRPNGQSNHKTYITEFSEEKWGHLSKPLSVFD